MAVLVEAISVIVRRDAIVAKYDGGWKAFVNRVSKATLCTDDEIVRLGFTAPDEVSNFIRQLEDHGLQFVVAGKAIDLAVADQQRGLTTQCEWLEFAKLNMGSGKVGACWLFEGPRMGHGLHMRHTEMNLATPAGWKFEGSMSDKFGFVPNHMLSDKRH